jgi:hypothetical protein
MALKNCSNPRLQRTIITRYDSSISGSSARSGNAGIFARFCSLVS